MIAKLAVSLLLVCCSVSVRAAPINFTSSLFQTNASVYTGISLVDDADTSPSSPLPIRSDALASNPPASGFAYAIANEGTFYTFANTIGADGFSSARFIGDFISTGDPIDILLDFDSFGGNTGTLSSAFGNLFVRLTSDGTVNLLQQFFSTGVFEYIVDVPAGASAQLLISVGSSARSLGGGDAASINQLTFSAQTQAVPEPATLTFLLTGLAMLSFFARRVSKRGR